MGYACWKRDENFNVQNHVRHLNVGTEKHAKKLLSQLSVEMGTDKPQWEMVLADFIGMKKFIYFLNYSVLMKKKIYLDPDGVDKTFIFFRLHHAYMDALSIMMLFRNYIATVPFDFVIDPLEFNIPWKVKLHLHITCLLKGASSTRI